MNLQLKYFATMWTLISSVVTQTIHYSPVRPALPSLETPPFFMLAITSQTLRLTPLCGPLQNSQKCFLCLVESRVTSLSIFSEALYVASFPAFLAYGEERLLPLCKMLPEGMYWSSIGIAIGTQPLPGAVSLQAPTKFASLSL